MSFLAEARQRAADFQWGRSDNLGYEIRGRIIHESGFGNTEITNFAVTEKDRQKGEALIKALNLEGFYAAWQDEGHRNIHVSWEVRHPRS